MAIWQLFAHWYHIILFGRQTYSVTRAWEISFSFVAIFLTEQLWLKILLLRPFSSYRAYDDGLVSQLTVLQLSPEPFSSPVFFCQRPIPHRYFCHRSFHQRSNLPPDYFIRGKLSPLDIFIRGTTFCHPYIKYSPGKVLGKKSLNITKNISMYKIFQNLIMKYSVTKHFVKKTNIFLVSGEET